MKVKVNNLNLIYPLKSIDNYLLRVRIVNKLKNLLLRKKPQNLINNINSEKSLLALRNINFEISSGDRLGLVGLNGSGKSTLLKCLSGILPYNKKEIEITDSGYLPIIQPYAMSEPDDTLYNNILLIGQIYGFNREKIEQQIDEILKFSELEDYKNRALATLSTGMKFRFVFAICFILEGKNIFFIDEFLTTGDEKFQNKGFEHINKKRDSILVLCSHSRRIIEKFCNKVLILNKGEQVFFGETKIGLQKYVNLIQN